MGVFTHILSLYAIARFSNMRSYTLSSRLLRGYLHQPYSWFLNRHSADLGKTILNEVNSVVNHTMIPTLKLISNIFICLFIVTLLVFLQPWVALGTAAALGSCYAAILVVARKYLTHFGRLRFEATRQRYRIAQEATGGIKDVKLLGLEDVYLRRFQIPSRQNARANTFRSVVSRVAALPAAGAGLRRHAPDDPGPALRRRRRVAGRRAAAPRHLRLRRPAPPAGHAADLRRAHHDPLQPDGAQFAAQGHGRDPRLPATRLPAEAVRVEPVHLSERLELVDVHYSYPLAERPALRGLSLSIPARTTVGIVGGTGAGKTTAVDLILGLLELQEGRLEADGVPIGRGNMRAWQNTIGYVPQQIFLTDDTVSANIAFGLPPEQIDQAAVERAARIAELHGFVTERAAPGLRDAGWASAGVRLSGGQRQRIGIARALYHDPDVLIMDEATSALDNLTERAVMDAVHNLGHAKTIILIAHRLTTVEACDIIFMMEQGRLVAQGTYDELLRRRAASSAPWRSATRSAEGRPAPVRAYSCGSGRRRLRARDRRRAPPPQATS